MTQDTPIKKYPASTSEVAKMLGIQGVSQDLAMGTFVSQSDLPVANLPVAPLAKTNTEPALADAALAGNHADAPTTATDASAEETAATLNPQNSIFVKTAKAAAPYVVVFGVGIFLYYFFFSSVNFNSIFKNSPKAVTPKESAVAQLEKQDLASYQKWISGYYYEVSDTKIIDPESDNSGNGLSNFQKYLLHLNPKSYDTLGTGIPDSQVLASGLDPATGSPLTEAQKDTVSKYIDMEVVMNRLTLNRLAHPEQVAGVGVNSNSFFNNTPQTTGVNINNGNVQTYPRGTSETQAVPQTGADLNSVSQSGMQINTSIPGRLEIPDLKVNVPIIWTDNTNNFSKDLQTGVVHYPGTALPGDIGTTYISGHSSNYLWAKGDFNRVFSRLGDLADNTSFKITVVQKNGKDAILHYVVTHRKEYSPTDQAQFANSGKSTVALSTCWPVGSTAKRLVVFGELTQIEK